LDDATRMWTWGGALRVKGAGRVEAKRRRRLVLQANNHNEGLEGYAVNVTLSKALIVLLPACLLLLGSAVLFLRQKTLFPFMQLLGAGCIVAVALTHVCESLHLVPGMHWGLEGALVTT